MAKAKDNQIDENNEPIISSTQSQDIMKEKTDLVLLKSLLQIVNNSKDDLEWILQKQNQLRTEYITFFKKDLKEIQASLGDIPKVEDVLIEIIQTYREDMNKSFTLVDTRHQEIVNQQMITKVTDMLREEMKILMTSDFEEKVDKLYVLLKPVIENNAELKEEVYSNLNYIKSIING